ncbi:hypothetical protein Q5424_28585 [Conexibacter sp. JD483]|uniref:hypothetical protein n=1 Tax=unclassified Conexibacter TaxID=2627773 RepID=UPI00271A4E56|nr:MULTISPECIES: hypothetical protein [unclassified Conexibacter]MDO8189586.1 hypothetical protein [Conexibacter sp. CPCC 205706]MDO8202130.1 hypothetical protein [Conexibacter sp. CPCC 205762]MDR9373089.1 hypothetical protein [Conexibacter sp. JD483]
MTDDESPDERRVHDLFGDVRRAPPPEPPARLEERVMRTARWQLAVRGTLRAVTELSAVVAGGLRGALGGSNQRRTR